MVWQWADEDSPQSRPKRYWMNRQRARSCHQRARGDRSIGRDTARQRDIGRDASREMEGLDDEFQVGDMQHGRVEEERD